MRSLLSVFSFRGRAKRTHYGIFFCVTLAALFVLSVPWSLYAMQTQKAQVLADMSAKDPNMARTFDKIISAIPHEIVVALLIAAGVAIFILYVAWIAICVRRLHDMNVTGWLVLLCIVVALFPYLGYLLVSLVLVAWPGINGANRYGPDPRRPLDIADVFSPDDPVGVAGTAPR